MLFNVLIIVSLEVLAVGCVCLGFIFGRYTQGHTTVKVKEVVLDEHMLDPITPEDQMLARKLERGVQNRETEE